LENEVKQPDRVRLQTDYFWRKWAPKLGPTLTVLVITLRSYCYYNKLTKERRDWCYPEQKTLADNIGVSVDTVQRELKKPIARQFVTREPRYRYDQRLKRPVRTADTYHIAMDDPLTAEDLQEVANMAKNRLESGEADSKPQNAAHPDKPVDKSPGKPQSAVHIATADRSSRTSTWKNDLRTLSKDIHRPLSGEQEALVEEILSVCGDEHSRRFYETVVRSTDRSRIWSALSQVKEAAATGNLKKSKGAFFTAIVKAQASERIAAM
ncbi:MAG: helix-turn-helix domain-containing protein, partial [Pirellulales bacterium]|nr:helix-turn-helix domain-containing protein [Pirellulales bacterium]